MPYVELSDIKPFISSSMYNALDTVLTGTTKYFTPIEEEAAKLIRDKTGRDIPATTADAPDWIIVPAAYIIQKLAKRLLTEISLEYNQQIDADYELALKMLAEHPNLDSDGYEEEPEDKSTSYTGPITGVVEW